MLIRTQNKMWVCNLENMETIAITKSLGEDNFFLTMFFSGKSEKHYYLGNYKTEERAIEVLDEICNAYLDLNIAKGSEFFGTNASIGYFGGYVKNGVFQMPEV